MATLDPPDTPVHRRTLRGLCAALRHLAATFPGTDLSAMHQFTLCHSELAA